MWNVNVFLNKKSYNRYYNKEQILSLNIWKASFFSPTSDIQLMHKAKQNRIAVSYTGYTLKRNLKENRSYKKQKKSFKEKLQTIWIF